MKCRVGLEISTHKTVRIDIDNERVKSLYKDLYEDINASCRDYVEDEVMEKVLETLVEGDYISIELGPVGKEGVVRLIGKDGKRIQIGTTSPTPDYDTLDEKIEAIHIGKGSWKYC